MCVCVLFVTAVRDMICALNGMCVCLCLCGCMCMYMCMCEAEGTVKGRVEVEKQGGLRERRGEPYRYL